MGQSAKEKSVAGAAGWLNFWQGKPNEKTAVK